MRRKRPQEPKLYIDDWTALITTAPWDFGINLAGNINILTLIMSLVLLTTAAVTGRARYLGILLLLAGFMLLYYAHVYYMERIQLEELLRLERMLARQDQSSTGDEDSGGDEDLEYVPEPSVRAARRRNYRAPQAYQANPLNLKGNRRYVAGMSSGAMMPTPSNSPYGQEPPDRATAPITLQRDGAGMVMRLPADREDRETSYRDALASQSQGPQLANMMTQEDRDAMASQFQFAVLDESIAQPGVANNVIGPAGMQMHGLSMQPPAGIIRPAGYGALPSLGPSPAPAGPGPNIYGTEFPEVANPTGQYSMPMSRWTAEVPADSNGMPLTRANDYLNGPQTLAFQQAMGLSAETMLQPESERTTHHLSAAANMRVPRGFYPYERQAAQMYQDSAMEMKLLALQEAMNNQRAMFSQGPTSDDFNGVVGPPTDYVQYYAQGNTLAGQYQNMSASTGGPP